uniref:EGF-like domain-containing protein n=1 Tax=Parascaris equorum TaxID=6256 RepID=A0A914RZN0_PAREQ
MRSLCLAMCLLALARAQRKAFVNPQSECRIQCLNGGFCAYLVDNPTVHTCLCLLDMFTGDHCQYRGKH